MTDPHTDRFRAYAEKLRQDRLAPVKPQRTTELPSAGVLLQLAADVITRLRTITEPSPGYRFPGSGSGPHATPMHVDAVDTADALTRRIVEWCRESGVPTTGHGKFWRHHREHPHRPGEIRGLVGSDTRPVQRLVNAYRLAERQLGHVEPIGLRNDLSGALTRAAQRYSSLKPVVREGLLCTN